ncbi:MAG: MltA-interacting MipA family protein [Desulfobulbus sp.]|nr:MltA-interacting MipA family protein [Desulfobulbus sp.]
MKRIFSMAALAALTLAGAASQAEAATATAAVDVNSAYVWRGLTFNDGMVLQPSITAASDNGFSVNVWGNYDINDYDGAVDENHFSEVDLTASYAFKLGSVDTTVGIVAYTFPTTYPDNLAGAGTDYSSTAEIFLGLGYDLGHGFSIAGNIYYDVDQVDDFYLTAGLKYAYDINEKTSLSLGGLISYAGEDFTAYYAGGTDSGFFNYILNASLSYKVTDAFGIGANIAYTDSMDDDALPDSAVDTTLYGGVSLSYTF